MTVRPTRTIVRHGALIATTLLAATAPGRG